MFFRSIDDRAESKLIFIVTEQYWPIDEDRTSKRTVIISSHAQTTRAQATYRRMIAFFNELIQAAPQLSPQMCWACILANAMSTFGIVIVPDPIKLLAAST